MTSPGALAPIQLAHATILAVSLAIAGCTTPGLPACALQPSPAPVAWLVGDSWHTEIGIPTAELAGPLAAYRTLFPGARTLMFGFGKRTFITAPAQTLSELILGPVPGPAAIQVTALNASPADAYPGRTIQLALPEHGPERISDFLWEAVGKTQAGTPKLISPGLFPGSAFYAATHGYDLAYTCNTWTADALGAAGLDIAPGPVFASTTLAEAAAVSGTCRPLPTR